MTKLRKSETLIEMGVDWLREKKVRDLIKRVDLTAIAREVGEDEKTQESMRVIFEIAWDWVIDEARREDRTIRELLGDEFASHVLRVVSNTDPDEDLARIIFRNPAAENMFGKILYDGITEFLGQADIIGTLLDKLPLIGGIKSKIQNNFPEGVQGIVEGRVKEFLGNFSGAACEKAMNFVLSPEHVDDVQSVQREVVEYYLNREARFFIPDDQHADEWKEAIWSAIEVNLNRVEEIVERSDRLYEDLNDCSVEDVIPESLPPTLAKLLSKQLSEFLSRESVLDESKALMKILSEESN